MISYRKLPQRVALYMGAARENSYGPFCVCSVSKHLAARNKPTNAVAPFCSLQRTLPIYPRMETTAERLSGRPEALDSVAAILQFSS